MLGLTRDNKTKRVSVSGWHQRQESFLSINVIVALDTRCFLKCLQIQLMPAVRRRCSIQIWIDRSGHVWAAWVQSMQYSGWRSVGHEDLWTENWSMCDCTVLRIHQSIHGQRPQQSGYRYRTIYCILWTKVNGDDELQEGWKVVGAVTKWMIASGERLSSWIYLKLRDSRVLSGNSGSLEPLNPKLFREMR